MWHYLLLLVSTLALLACPSKPQRRAPTVTENSQNAQSASSIKEGLYLALQHAAGGYEPVVLRVASGLVTKVTADNYYSQAAVFSADEQELKKSKLNLSQQNEQAINLLLVFKEDNVSYCVESPLAEVLKWVKLEAGESSPVIKQKLPRAQPIDASSKGTKEGDKCTR